MMTTLQIHSTPGFANLVDCFVEELGSPPTLGELLEILSWAVSGCNSTKLERTVLDDPKIRVTVEGGREGCYGLISEASSRVPGLNDNVFAIATECIAALIEHSSPGGCEFASLEKLGSAILEILQSGQITLADVEGKDIRDINIVRGQKARKLTRGDVLTVPTKRGGFYMAVMLTRNRFGTALGFLRGVSQDGNLDLSIPPDCVPFVVFTTENLIEQEILGSAAWRIVGHDEALLSLFPAQPEIYHKANAWPGIIDCGEFGAAETSDGAFRLIGRGEARQVGLLDGTYSQTVTAEYLADCLRPWME